MKERSNTDTARILVLGSDESLNADILAGLREAAPEGLVDIARTPEEAQRLAVSDRPNLIVVDLEAANEWNEDFLLDLRTSHPQARAIVLADLHLTGRAHELAEADAIHFLGKPLPKSEFTEAVRTLLRPVSEQSDKFHGTLSDLHLSDIIQLKCMSGSTTALAFTGPQGEEARIYFDQGQVRHALTPGRQGVDAFHEIVGWRGGKISELREADVPPQTINVDWQFLLMEAMRKVDETSARRERRKQAQSSERQKILVIDDSLMLLSFVQEILAEANYDVIAAANGEEGLSAAAEQKPGLVLLDYLLPDIKGDEVSRRLGENSATADIPVLFMSGFGGDLGNVQTQSRNVFGILNKPFTSDMLLQTVEQHLPKIDGATAPESSGATDETTLPFANVIGAEFETTSAGERSHRGMLWNDAPQSETDARFMPPRRTGAVQPAPSFSGNTDFFSLARALHAIAQEGLTGVLRCFWTGPNVELFAREGKIALVTTADPDLYCSDAPVTLVNIDPERVDVARRRQAETGEPLFLCLAAEDLIQREPARQLVQHYGQKLFAQLWSTPHVRFLFEKQDSLPSFARDSATDEEVDFWAINCLRFVQAQDSAEGAAYDPNLIPAYTCAGFERVQHLRFTVAEAQFASQFNGSRSLAQIARNLRLDLKSARLTLFRFVALEIVELWPASAPEKIERGGVLKRFGRSMGLGS